MTRRKWLTAFISGGNVTGCLEGACGIPAFVAGIIGGIVGLLFALVWEDI